MSYDAPEDPPDGKDAHEKEKHHVDQTHQPEQAKRGEDAVHPRVRVRPYHDVAGVAPRAAELHVKVGEEEEGYEERGHGNEELHEEFDLVPGEDLASTVG